MTQTCSDLTVRLARIWRCARSARLNQRMFRWWSISTALSSVQTPDSEYLHRGHVAESLCAAKPSGGCDIVSWHACRPWPYMTCLMHFLDAPAHSHTKTERPLFCVELLWYLHTSAAVGTCIHLLQLARAYICCSWHTRRSVWRGWCWRRLRDHWSRQTAGSAVALLTPLWTAKGQPGCHRQALQGPEVTWSVMCGAYVRSEAREWEVCAR
jgi:hypothetical protein